MAIQIFCEVVRLRFVFFLFTVDILNPHPGAAGDPFLTIQVLTNT